jgi:hypothetical protein
MTAKSVSEVTQDLRYRTNEPRTRNERLMPE